MYEVPEPSPGLLRGKFVKFFGHLLSKEGDMIILVTMCASTKAVFRMLYR